MGEFRAEDLISIGFRNIAEWKRGQVDGQLDYTPHPSAEADFPALIDSPNALYAFVGNNLVYYIGKTARSLKKRFYGYRFPSPRQTTNIVCNREISSLLDKGKRVEIYIFAAPSDLQWNGHTINLAAGLEDSLIQSFQPTWNGGKSAAPETVINEKSATASDKEAEAGTNGAARGTRFRIKLGKTYYQTGFINPGKLASDALGQHGQPIIVTLGSDVKMQSKINRTANSNGSVRLVGDNGKIAAWLQRNFKQGDVAPQT